jgi:hypothetical protein
MSSSARKLDTTRNRNFSSAFNNARIPSFYIDETNTLKSAELSQAGHDVEHSVNIDLGESASIQVPIHNHHFTGNMFFYMRGRRGKYHSAKGLQGFQGMDLDQNDGTHYTSPTGNFLPFSAYSLIRDLRITFPGGEEYRIDGNTMLTWAIAQCETEADKDEIWRLSQIKPAVKESADSEYPNTFVIRSRYSASTASDDDAGEVERSDASKTLGAPSGQSHSEPSFEEDKRMDLIDDDYITWEAVLLLPLPWCSPNRNQKPLPFPSHKLSAPLDFHISLIDAYRVNSTVNDAVYKGSPGSIFSVDMMTLNYEYFTFMNPNSIRPGPYTYGTPQVFSQDYHNPDYLTDGDYRQYNINLTGLKPGECQMLLVQCIMDNDECIVPYGYQLKNGGQTISVVDKSSKLSEAFALQYNDQENYFNDTRFQYVADAHYYDGGTSISIDTSSDNVYQIDLRKKPIDGLPIVCWLFIPLGTGAAPTQYHNYVLGTRLGDLQTQLTFWLPKVRNPITDSYSFRDVKRVRVIQVNNGVYQFDGAGNVYIYN